MVLAGGQWFLPCQSKDSCVQPHLWQLCFDEAWCFPNNDESNGAKGLCKLEAAFGVWRPEAPHQWAWKLPMVQWCPAVWCCAGWADQRLNLDPEPCPGCCGWMLVRCRDCQSLLGAELQAGQLSAQSNLSWLELDPGEGPHQAGGFVDRTCSNLITAVISQTLFTFVYSPHLRKTLIAIAACRRAIAENVSQAGMTWGKMEKKHNDDFNPSGQSGWPPELLVPSGVSDPHTSFQTMLGPNEGTLFLKGLKDGAVTSEAKVDCLCGSGRNGKARGPVHWQRHDSQHHGSCPADWHSWAATASSSIGELVESSGFVHQWGRLSSTSTRRKMAPLRSRLQKPIAFVLEINNTPVDPKKVIEPSHLSTYVDVTKIKHVQAVQIVKYEPRLHLIIELIFLQMHIGAAVEKMRWATVNASCF